MKNKKEILIISILIIIQTIIYVCVGINKSYIHIDEAYSFGLANYDKVEIEHNEDFFNTWHEKGYYEDYLSVQEDEIGDFTPVYENQKNDVHPPFYYLLLRIAMNFTEGHFSKWPGIVLNIIIYAFVTIFMYLILKKLFSEEKYSNIKAAILAFISSITLASISNVVYIRMYSLLTLEILITILLHIKLLESEKTSLKLLIGIGISVLAGVLTHYYFLFYLVILYLIFLIKYIKEKKVKALLHYTLTMLISGIVSLIIFPYSISHMFFGNRGQSVINNLENTSEIIPSIFEQIYNLNYYVFSCLLPVIIVAVIILVIIRISIFDKIRKKELPKAGKEKKDIIRIILIPSIFFFLLTSIASPWKVLRYMVPVCGLIFILEIYYLYKLIQTIFSEKISNILICISLCMILVAPFIFHLEPELLYTDHKEIVQELSGELNLPTIYIYDTNTAGFLNDILLFSMIDESYIAKDIDCTEKDIQDILQSKDIANGIIVFISDGQNNDTIIDTIKRAINFTNCEHLQRLWCSNVYYIH